jgi:UDP-N-acetylmuramate--alanine ligase
VKFADKAVHLIGIGGIGMSGIARVLIRRGARLTGSDLNPGPRIHSLKAAGAEIKIGHRRENISPDVALVVVSAAIKQDNPEVVEAQRRGLKIAKYAQVLGWLMDEKKGIAISGTHGKSTTTALVAYILERAGLSPTFVVGAEIDALGGSSATGEGEYFVAEACEYDRSFLHLSPFMAIINNVEADHLDYYRDLNEIVEAFGDFASRVKKEGLLLVNADDPLAVQAGGSSPASVETYALSSKADWQAGNLKSRQGRYEFEVSRRDEHLGRFSLSIPGTHNVANALGAIGLACNLKLPLSEIKGAVEDFCGARRRFEILGNSSGVVVVDDYGHHPTEVRLTLRAAREFFPGRRIFCVFQPHQHSRTRFLREDFAVAFSDADFVLVPDIYFVRDSQAERLKVSSEDLVKRLKERGKEALYLPSFEEICDHLLKDLKAGDVLLTMGAGNVDEIAREILQRFGGKGQI